MKRWISSVVFESTVAIAPVASGTRASVLSAAAPCQKAKRRFGEAGVLVDSVMDVFQSRGIGRTIIPGEPSSNAFASASSARSP